jgi:carboxyvinyl-carboxyphosphonate phosphorylmutase
LVVGRTSAAGITDEDDMLRRLTAYGQEGCHALMPVGKISMEALRELSKAAKLPIVLSARPDNADLGDLAQLEVRVLLSGHEPFKAAMRAALLAFADIHGRTVEDIDVMEAITGPGSAR